jgi:hypothetical protein
VNTISSKQTYFSKRVFPILWLGGVAIFLVFGLATATSHQVPADPMVLVVPVVMLVFGFVLFRKLLWDLADEVQDGGSFLLVRKGPVEQRIPLANITNVSMSQLTNPKRLTLRLRTPCEFGDEVVFIPKAPLLSLNPFARNAVAEDLMRRVDQARMKAVP